MIKQFIVPFIGMFLLAVFILLMQFLWKYIDDLIGKGLELKVIAELFIYITPHVATEFAFPLAMLLASIFTLGNLGESYELIALKAAGISLQRILFPLVVTSVVISISAFLVANYVTPGAYLRWRTLIYDITQLRPELHIPEGVFYNGIDDYSIRINRRDPRTNMMYDLRIYDHRNRLGNVSVILADSGRMMKTVDSRFLEVELFSGHSYEDVVSDADRRKSLEARTFPFMENRFERQVFRMALPGYDLERSDLDIFKTGFKMLNLEDLSYMIDSISDIIVSQEERLRMLVLPTYRSPDLHYAIFDSVRRSKIPENFQRHFSQQSKNMRQMSVQEALNNARNQKDQMVGFIYELENHNRRTWRYKIAWHQKLAMPFACLVFFFIGAPLGAIIRKGGVGMPIIIAIIFYVFYYVISMIGEKSAREGAMTPFEGMWMSAAIILAIGIFLTWMATRDSQIFNIELYTNYAKKIIRMFFAVEQSERPQIEYNIESEELLPENMVESLEDLSRLCREYLEGDFRNEMKLTTVWAKAADANLSELAYQYDKMRARLRFSDEEMIRETVAEYPNAGLKDFKIMQTNKWQVPLSAIVFPIWIYLYIRVKIQKRTLHNEITAIIGSNKNLSNELHCML